MSKNLLEILDIPVVLEYKCQDNYNKWKSEYDNSTHEIFNRYHF
jgi:hypothetical protein